MPVVAVTSPPALRPRPLVGSEAEAPAIEVPHGAMTTETAVTGWRPEAVVCPRAMWSEFDLQRPDNPIQVA